MFKHDKEQYLVSLFIKGDARAMDKLYEEYADYLTTICSWYVHNKEDLHDVLQESFIRIFTGMTSFQYQGKGSLNAWLKKVVINEALHFLRDNNSDMFVDKEPDLPDSEDDEVPNVNNYTISQLTDSIRQLPSGYRAVFNLYVLEGKSHKEIAEILNIKPDTSASQYYKAKKMLIKMLKQHQTRKENDER